MTSTYVPAGTSCRDIYIDQLLRSIERKQYFFAIIKNCISNMYSLLNSAER